MKNTGLRVSHDTVGDFWRWAFGDLKANDIRGVFAEWMVGRILGLPRPHLPRDSWAECDLRTEDGFRIEVKTGAYLQTWEQKSPSRIVFTGLKGQTWNPADGYSGQATYNADLYVFCLQTEKDHDRGGVEGDGRDNHGGYLRGRLPTRPAVGLSVSWAARRCRARAGGADTGVQAWQGWRP